LLQFLGISFDDPTTLHLVHQFAKWHVGG
jgi:hypothetical protein